jgi:DNA-directed RNA polymerase specialized sigma24 family protein
VETFIERMACIPAILERKNRKLPFAFKRDELQDLAQDVFARIWGKLETFAGEGCLEAWAYRFCHNVMMNAQQSRWRRHRRAGDPGEAVDFKDLPRQKDAWLTASFSLPDRIVWRVLGLDAAGDRVATGEAEAHRRRD